MEIVELRERMGGAVEVVKGEGKGLKGKKTAADEEELRGMVRGLEEEERKGRKTK